MAFKHGRTAGVWFNSTDVSTYLRSAGFTATMDPGDKTTFGKTWKEYDSGLLSATFPFEGMYDASATGADAIVQDALGSDNGILTYMPAGATVGDLARLAPIIHTSWTNPSPVGDMVTFGWEATNAGTLNFGHVIHAWSEDTNTTTGSAIDQLAATSTGWTGHLQCSLVDGGSWVITIEDSSTGSSGWAAIATFAALTTAGYERLQSADSTTTVKRYIRVVATRTGGSVGNGITYGLAFARSR